MLPIPFRLPAAVLYGSRAISREFLIAMAMSRWC